MIEDIDYMVPAYDFFGHRLQRVCPDHIGLYGFRELVRRNFISAHAPVDLHMHPDAIELSYAYRGGQYYTVGQREYALEAGDVFVTNPNEMHSGGERAQAKGCLLYYMIIDTVNSLDRFMGLDAQEGQLLAQQLMALPRSFRAGYELKPHFDEMFRIYRERLPLSPLLMRSQFSLLVHRLTCAADQHRRPNRAQILNVLDAIEEQLPSVPKISELAEMMYLSESYFKQKFRKEIGVPPAKYIMQRRIALAQRMLSDGMGVTEAAFSLGFSSSQHFATYFKEYTRLTPSEWRRMHSMSPGPDA